MAEEKTKKVIAEGLARGLAEQAAAGGIKIPEWLTKLFKRDPDSIITASGVMDDALVALILNAYRGRVHGKEKYELLMKLRGMLTSPEREEFGVISNAIILTSQGINLDRKAKKPQIKLDKNTSKDLFAIYDCLVADFAALLAKAQLEGKEVDHQAITDLLKNYSLYGNITARKLLAAFFIKEHKGGNLQKLLEKLWRDGIKPEILALQRKAKSFREKMEREAKAELEKAKNERRK